jgi:Ca2+-transporting ATPase
LVLVQLIHVFECKSESKNLLHINIFNNVPLILAALLSFAMIVGVIYIPLLQPVFSTVALTMPAIMRVALYSLIGPVLAVIIFRNKAGRRLSRRVGADAARAAK